MERRDQIADVDDPDDLVERLPIHRVARVRRLEHRRHRLLGRELDRERDDVRSRHHHVRDLLLGEVEHLVEHLPLVLLDLAVLGRDLEEHLQLGLRVGLALDEARVDADRPLRHLAGALEHPDQGLEDEEEHAHGRRDPERDPLRVAERDALRNELADDDVEESDDQEGEEHREDGREPLVEEPREHGFAERADRERGERDAELHRGDEVRRVARDREDRAGGAAPLVRELLHPGASHGDERVLAGDEERVEEDQEDDCEQLQRDGHRRFLARKSRRRDDGECRENGRARPVRGAGTGRQLVVHYCVAV